VSGSVYGGGYGAATTVGSTSVVISGGSAQYVYGGGNNGAVTGGTSVVVSGGTVSGSVYGGGMSLDATVTGKASVGIKGTAIVSGNVIGGGHSATSTVGSTSVEILGGTIIHDVYGGGYYGAVTGSTSVNISGGTMNYVFGGGYRENATVGSTSIEISGGTINNNVFGGGYRENATVGSTSIEISGGTINNNVYGGGLNGAVSGIALVRIGVDATITGIFTEQCYNTDYTVGGGSHVEYEVAFYDADGTTRLAAPASQWVTESTAAVQPSSPSKSGFKFEKWLDGADEFDFATLITIPQKLTST